MKDGPWWNLPSSSSSRSSLREQPAFYDQHQKELPLPERKERLRFDLASQNLYWEVVSRCTPVGALPWVTFSISGQWTQWGQPDGYHPVAVRLHWCDFLPLVSEPDGYLPAPPVKTSCQTKGCIGHKQLLDDAAASALVLGCGNKLTAIRKASCTCTCLHNRWKCFGCITHVM